MLRSFIVLCTVLLSFGQFDANKIKLKPQGFNITFNLSKISLQILICNITYTYRREPVLRPVYLFLKYITHYDTFDLKVSIFNKRKMGEHSFAKVSPTSLFFLSLATRNESYGWFLLIKKVCCDIIGLR